MKSSILVIFLILCIDFSSYADSSIPIEFSVPTLMTSHFKREKDGSYALLNNTPILDENKNEKYLIDSRFSNTDTAFVVIDPWDNMPDEELNSANKKVIKQYIVPLIKLAAEKEFQVFIFTNDCERLGVSYSCSLPQEIAQLKKQSPYIHIYYWSDYSTIESASKLFSTAGVKKLIYMGFASNICIINRPAGMVSMLQSGFSTFFVPEASAAIETEATKYSKSIHKHMITIISQSIGKIIYYKDIFKNLKKV